MVEIKSSVQETLSEAERKATTKLHEEIQATLRVKKTLSHVAYSKTEVQVEVP